MIFQVGLLIFRQIKCRASETLNIHDVLLNEPHSIGSFSFLNENEVSPKQEISMTGLAICIPVLSGFRAKEIQIFAENTVCGLSA